MDLKDLGEALAKLGLPLLGASLPIPGGAVIGTALANEIGAQSNSPDDILSAVAASQDALQKAKDFQLTHQETMLRIQCDYEVAQRDADVSDVGAVNATMIAESRTSAVGWRSFCGYVVGVASMITVAGVLYLAYLALSGKDPQALNAIPTIVSSIAMVLVIPGSAVGITAWHHGMADRIAAQGDDSKV